VKPFDESDLHAYVDGLLPDAERSAVESHLAGHPEDAERVRAWCDQNSALRALYEPVLAEPVPAQLAVIPPRPVWPRYAAAAGVFAIGIALGWVMRGSLVPPAPPVSFARQAAIAHVVYTPEVRHPVEVPGDQEDHLVRWLSKRLGTELTCPKLGPLGYELVGGRLLSGSQGPVAHFMFQDGRGQRLTLYVAKQRGELRDTAFRFSQEDRVSVFYWVDRDYGYALSGELGREQLLRVANVVYKQLNP
jgi:anti-sigma factor RsiW